MTSFVGANLSKTYTAAQLLAGDAPGVNDVYETTDGRRYRFVKFDNGAGNVAAVDRKAAYWFGTSAASTGAIDTVTMDLTDAVGAQALVAGVFQSAPADGEYCWIQTWGLCTFATTVASGADGYGVTGPVTAGTDGALINLEGVASGEKERQHVGHFIDASAKILFLTIA